MKDTSHTIAQLYRNHYRALLAPLIRILGSFSLAEDVVQDAFAQAMLRWDEDGLPDMPLAWLRRTARNRAIDHFRRHRTWTAKAEELASEVRTEFEMSLGEEEVRDDALRLIFTCCHPALAPASQIALTLRTVCGFTTEQAARAMLVQHATLQQRIVRAKRKIDAANIPYEIPDLQALPERLATALKTIYLVFSEGYGATDGDELVRHELCDEGIRLARLLSTLLPSRSSPKAVLALMLLHHSRKDARTDKNGDLVTLDNQDRSRWDPALIAEALPMVEQCLLARPISNYAIEAAIAAVHAGAENADDTDWPQIAGLYAILERRSHGNPVVSVNAAVAVAMAGNLEAGLRRLDQIETENLLPSHYHLLPAARGDLLRRLGRTQEAQEAYSLALERVSNDVERRFLERRLSEIETQFEKSETI